MILDTTVHTKEIKEKMAELVGNPFGFLERIRLGGVGSKRMRIHSASEHFKGYFSKQADTIYCNIELRKTGIVIHFKKYQTVYSWLIPMESLKLDDNSFFTLISNEYSLSIVKDRLYQENKVFIERLI